MEGAAQLCTRLLSLHGTVRLLADGGGMVFGVVGEEGGGATGWYLMCCL